MKAFPRLKHLEVDRNDNYDAVYEDEGMDLRDYFAAKAMQSLIGNNEYLDNIQKYRSEGESMFSSIPYTAYQIADGMMEKRK